MIKPLAASSLLFICASFCLQLSWLLLAPFASFAADPQPSVAPLPVATPPVAAPYQVVFIRYPIEPGRFGTVVEKFKSTMAEQGYREGREVRYFDILISHSDQRAIPQVIAAVERYRERADIFITCGWVSIYARELLKDSGVPQLFVPVLRSVALEMLPSVGEAPAVNLSGVYLMYEPEKILRLAHLLLPGAADYAYVYDSRIPADLVYKKGYQELAAADRHGFTLHFFDLAAGVEQVLTGLKERGVDAYGGIVGVFQQRLALAAAGLPVITSYTLDIDRQSLQEYMGEDNIVAGLFNPFAYAGERAAKMTADILAGRTTIEESVHQPAMQVAFINMQNAGKLKLSIPFAALEAVDFVIR